VESFRHGRGLAVVAGSAVYLLGEQGGDEPGSPRAKAPDPVARQSDAVVGAVESHF
jgi:hypothetical protein